MERFLLSGWKLETQFSSKNMEAPILDGKIVSYVERMTFSESLWTEITVEMVSHEVARFTDILNSSSCK